MIKKNFKRLLAILLALTPMALAAACNQSNNSASDKNPSDIVEGPSESDKTPSDIVEGPSDETPPEGGTTEEEPSEDTTTKPSLPGGLQDGGNFVGRG